MSPAGLQVLELRCPEIDQYYIDLQELQEFSSKFIGSAYCGQVGGTTRVALRD